MRTKLIAPDQLEWDAVVPQCLDNQFVSDAVFSKMVGEGLDFTDREIARLRENDFRTEFIRSLIYSSQVVIQRAYLKNSDFLHKNFVPEDNANFNAFAGLLRERAVVPFLFKESSLLDEHEFDVHREGDRAVKTLVGELDEIVCVRLAADETAAKKSADDMATAFGLGLARLAMMSGDQRDAVVNELVRDKKRLREEGARRAANKALKDLGTYAFNKNSVLQDSDRQLQRQHVYVDNFVEGGADVVLRGGFRKPGRDNPFALELKKYVDLVYNVNLPDHLRCYTFTPENMPSRMAMQDAPGKSFSDGDVRALVSNADALESIRRTFMARSQTAMSLPLLRDLSVADVAEIRALPEWRTFKDSQTAVLERPTELLARLEAFQRDFDAFQTALSKWRGAAARGETVKKYCSYVSLALSLGGRLFVAGAHHIGPVEKAIGGFVADQAVKLIPERILTYAAKLMVNVYDVNARKLDADRSYSIELMSASCDLTRDDVVDLLRSIEARAGVEPLPKASDQVADQGVK